MVYQVWCSIDAWLKLSGPDQVIYLEGVEDFDVTRDGDVVEVQVRHTAEPVSLGSAKALAALENFWISAQNSPAREVAYLYHTTSAAALEADRPFGEEKGIELWRVAQTSPEVAARIGEYLRSKLPSTNQLRRFLESASPEEVRDRLIRPFTWLPDQPGIDQVRGSVDDRLTILLNSQGRALSLVETVRNRLAAYVWEQVIQKRAETRVLTYGELLRQVDSAYNILLPLPLERIQALVLNQEPGLVMLTTMRYVGPDGMFPGRILAGSQIQVGMDQIATDNAETRWSIVRARAGEMMMPDYFGELGIVPVSPTCVLHVGPAGIMLLENVRAFNRAAQREATRYVLARDFAACPV
jgi:hypothetical protein